MTASPLAFADDPRKCSSDDAPEIILDLSRLLSRAFHPSPTGIDRVEMAYARELLRVAPKRLSFALFHPFGWHGCVSRDAALRFLDQTERRWTLGQETSGFGRRWFGIMQFIRLLPVNSFRARNSGRPVYVIASHNNLTRPRRIARMLHRRAARLICLLHDIIPLEFPEYARPDGADQHLVRLRTITRYADGILTNSHATMAALTARLEGGGRPPILAVAHLGVDVKEAQQMSHILPDRPFFLCVGTIEPRKNHLLLLNVWRRMTEELGPSKTPLLVLVGRRGWENEQVVDMLERCPALSSTVLEHGRVPDGELTLLMTKALGLLLPSFAEGYGLPVTEALSTGLPVICSDLPALREAGGDVPDFLDPLDGPAWHRAVSSFTEPDSPMRAAQIARLRDWRPPSWEEHIAILLDMLHRLPA